MRPATCKESSPRCASACAILIALVALAPAAARATGSDDVEDGEGSFFAPEIIERPDEAPFFLSPHLFYMVNDNGAPPFADIEAVNQKEWSAYLHGKVAEANLGFLLYKMSLGELDKLIWTLEGKPRAPKLDKETAALKADLDQVGDKGQVLRALYYLGFAKRCEPIATRMLVEDAWDDDKLAAVRSRDAASAAKLLAASEKQLAATQDPFLKDRYRFQRLRLMFYAGRYDDAEAYYSASIGAFATESSVKYRFMDVAGGAYYHDKEYGQANYLYSLVFARFPPLKRAAGRSFHPVEDADWKQALSLARGARERAVMWQLLGIHADGQAAIQAIYGLDPASDLLPLLLVREVNKAEEDWRVNEERRQVQEMASQARPDADAVGKERVALVKRIADGRKALKPYLWQLALAHLYALGGDTRASLSYLAQAEKAMPRREVLTAQVRMTRLFARVRALKAVDKAQEPYLAAELGWLAASNDTRMTALRRWVLDRLSPLYRQAGDGLRALMLVDEPTADLYLHNGQIDKLLEFQARPGKSAFDRFLVQNHGYERAQLLELKALNDLYAGRFQEAAALLAAGPETTRQDLRADPFVIHIVDCHDCDFQAKRAATYNKRTFAARLLALSLQAARSGPEAAQASFLLANGLYNMSYYGNARDVYTTAHGNFPDKIALNTGMDLAEKYYKRAMELSRDKEFQARACFMAAKTEQNRYFNAQAKNPNQPEQAVHSPLYFKALKDKYADTLYYKEIVRECGYFRRYLGR